MLVSVTACSSPPAETSAAQEAQVCANLLRVAMTAADPSRTGDRTSFGTAQNLLEADSLYETTWGIRLSALRHDYPVRLNKRVTATWLLQQIVTASSPAVRQQGSSVDTIRDAVEGLAALGDADKIHSDPFQAFRSDWGYAATPGAPPDFTSTAVAIEGLAAVGLKPPSNLVEFMTGKASEISPSDSLSTALNTDLTALQVVSPSDSSTQLLTLVPTLKSDLIAWNHALIAFGAGGVQLADLAKLQQVANRLALKLPPAPRSWATTLNTSGGFLALSKGGQGDPQVTYIAMKLGVLPTSTPLPALDSGVTPSGWLIASHPTLESFYDISALHALCKSPLKGEEQQLGHWINSVLAESDPTSQSAYEVCALRSIYRAPLSQSKQSQLIQDARARLNDAEKDSSVTAHELAEAYVAARACGADVRLADLPPIAYKGGSGTSSLDAFGAQILAGGKSTSAYAAGIVHFLRSTRRGTDYLYDSAERAPDVYSTGLALDIVGASEQRRARALKAFSSQGSWAVQVPDAETPTPGASLGSLLAVAFLITGTDSKELSPLFIT